MPEEMSANGEGSTDGIVDTATKDRPQEHSGRDEQRKPLILLCVMMIDPKTKNKKEGGSVNQRSVEDLRELAAEVRSHKKCGQQHCSVPIFHLDNLAAIEPQVR